jgi:hypothetical protein
VIQFREPKPEDYALVANSFWKGTRGIPSLEGVEHGFLMSMLREVIIKPHWRIAIEYDDSEPDEILCWCVWRAVDEVFWLATAKPRFFRCGFATKMLEHVGIVPGMTVKCPILPPVLLSVAGKNGIKLVQRPYLGMS